MKTRIRVIRPGQPDEVQEHDLPREPSYEKLAALIEPILGKGHWLERVSVLADFDGGENHQPTDMFVDENGHYLQLPFNREATRIYRRAYLKRHPHHDPAEMPHVVGPAILFDRRVWF
ncbi:hypothetical protein [uncultured Devosia sp.]|uniref:hypothetical protein n=1 Tax=uncultured Devosia sp. TaxID=211434 RepID=UPI00261D4510|nr:hypothetical protein [uncultured Devosia sp.]